MDTVAEIKNEQVEQKVEEVQSVEQSTDQAEQKEEVTPQYEDRHEIKPVLRDEKVFSEKNSGSKLIGPSGTYKETLEFQQKADRLEEDFIKSGYTNEEKIASYIAIRGGRYSTVEDDYVQSINEEKDRYVNDVNYADKNLVTKKLSFTDDRKEMTQSAAVARLRSLMSAGDLIQVPLWHSGFWVTLTPPSLLDLTNLDFSLADTEVLLGRETSTLLYSNYSVITNRIVSEFIVNHIHETSLEIENGDDIRNYIMLPDFHILVNALCATMHPDGYNIVKTCRNVLTLDDNNKPKCDFRLEAVVDPKRLVFVDRKSLSNKMLEHMSNRGPRSVTINSAKDYQLSIKQLLDKTVNIKSENGTDFKVVLSMPTLLNHVVLGEHWVNKMIKASETVFTESDTDDSKTSKMQQIVATCQLGTDNSFIKSINRVITDENAILEVLSIMSEDDLAYTELRKSIRDFINTAVIAMVATPSYVCPKCGLEHDGVEKGNFKDFIPLNIIDHFFALSTLRREKPLYRVG